VDLRRETLGTDDPRTLDAQVELADFLQRGPARDAEAITLALQTWKGRARVLGPEHRDTLESLGAYATCLDKTGQSEEAIRLLRTCLAARQRTLGASHPDTAISMNELAVCLWRRGEYQDAIPEFRKAVELHGLAGRETELAVSSANLGACLEAVGEFEEADRLLGESLERATKALSPDHQATDRIRWLQIRVWVDQGHLERAVALGRDALVVRKRIYAAGHPMIAAALMDLGRGLVLLNRFDQAEAALKESVSIFAKSPNVLAKHYPAWSECWYGASLSGRRRHAEAESHLLAAEKVLRESRTMPRRQYRQCVEQIVKFYESWGKPDDTARWRNELAALDDSRKSSKGKGGGANGSER
jgi:tetratricopeptide (TPR) repeat protein